MRLFSQIGLCVEQQWRAHHFDERSFPEIATSVLTIFDPAKHLSYTEVIEALLFDPRMPPQPQDLSFGQPPITVYSHPRFYIEVLCWMDATTTIHQHGFSGAFHVLAGSSVHTRYEFVLQERINQHLLLGDVCFLSCEILNAGDTRMIRAGKDFIHALFHLDRPSISVVLRTRGEAEAGPQYNYLPPHVALNPFARQNGDAQREQILRMLLASDRSAFGMLVERLLTEADFSTVYRVLQFVYLRSVTPPYDLSAEEVTDFFEVARQRFGARIDQIGATIVRAAKFEDLGARRAEVTKPEHRFFLALLMNLPHRRHIESVLRQRYAREPSLLILRWLQEMTHVSPDGTVSLLDIAIDGTTEDQGTSQEALVSLLHTTLEQLYKGARNKVLLGRLREIVAVDWLEGIEDGVMALQEKILQSTLHPLFQEEGQS